jgi:S1-C subfamily serine protease
MDSPLPQSNQTVRLSLSSLLFGFLLIFAISIIGGIVGARLVSPPLPPLTDDANQLITTVQEVTISPSMAITQLVTNHQRSVMLLAEVSGSDAEAVGTGIVITNDGVIVSTRNVRGGAVVFDTHGNRLPITRIGTDELHGLTYYRLEDSVIPPFELSTNNPSVGALLVALSRSAETTSPKAVSWQLEEYVIPTPPASMGWQQIARFAPSPDPTLAGSPLVTDEGKLAAIIVDPAQGTAIPVSIIRSSLDRLTNDTLNVNPFEQWGLSLTYQFRDTDDQTKREFTARVASITPASPAAAIDLRAGDSIKAINDTELEWTSPIAKLLKEEDIELTIMRGGQSRTVVLSSPSAEE